MTGTRKRAGAQGEAEAGAACGEALYRSLIEGSPDGVVLVDGAGRITLWNAAIAEITGLPGAEALGKEIWSIAGRFAPKEAHEALQQRARAMVMEAQRSCLPRTPPTMEWAIYRPDGGRRIVQATITAFPTPEGYALGSYLRDITALKEGQADRERLLRAVEAQRQRIRAVIDSAPEAIAVFRAADSAIEIINPMALQLVSGPDVVGRPLAEAAPVNAPRLVPVLQQVLRTGEPFHASDAPVQVYRGGAGAGPLEEAFFDFSLVPLRNPEGKMDAVLAMAVETTEYVRARRRVEELARTAGRRAAELDATINAIGDGLIIYGPDGGIQRMNRAAEAFLEATAEEYWALPLEERAPRMQMTTPSGRPLAPEEMPAVRALRGETVSGYRMVGRRDGRWREVIASAGPIRDPEGRIIGSVVSFADITAITQLEEQREDLLRAVSHDLRTPLTGILGEAQLLERRLERAGAGERERQPVQSIIASARRMDAMIQELVDAARLESGQLKLKLAPVDLPRLAGELVQRLAAHLDAWRIEVQAAELPPVLADPDRSERVLTNLLTNALKYSTPGTPVTVSFEVRDGEVVISVTDRGPGIRPEDMPRLFERYRRAAAPGEREGLGLGLYVSRQLVEAQGGRIWASSQLGVGSTFSFSLPIAGTEGT